MLSATSPPLRFMPVQQPHLIWSPMVHRVSLTTAQMLAFLLGQLLGRRPPNGSIKEWIPSTEGIGNPFDLMEICFCCNSFAREGPGVIACLRTPKNGHSAVLEGSRKSN